MLVSLICLYFSSYAVIGSDLPGHLERLGQQHVSEGHIEILHEVPDALSFHENYVLKSKPCVFKGAAKQMPAFQSWTDEFLKSQYGDLKVDIEEGKKENRSMPAYVYTLKDFVDKYQKEDIYLVHSIQKEMRGDVQLLPCLSCGGFKHVVQDIVMWFSSGGTKSVLHFDMIDNINCLFSGTKELFMIDKKHEKLVPLDHESGSYSNVDVDAVDLDKYKEFSELPWYDAKMEPGDCLYIPQQWYHQVRSAGRNIAVNVWFTRLPIINETDCDVNKDHGYVPLDGLVLKSPEAIKLILSMAVGEKGLKSKKFQIYMKKFTQDKSRRTLKALLMAADVNGDKIVTRDDISQMTKDNIKVFNQLTEFGFGGYDEDEGEESEEGEEEPLEGQPLNSNDVDGSKDEL